MGKGTVNVEFGKCPLIKEEEEIRHALRREEEIALPSSNIRSGKLYFGEHEKGSKHIPFMFCPYTTNAQEVVDKIFQDFKLSVPRIILFAYTETEDFPSDEYRQISQKLVKGLLHVLNTTEMWLCTDGLNNGFSRDIGKAYEDETEIRKTMESSLKNTALTDTTLIGICRKDRLKFSYKLDGAIPYETENKVPELKRDINDRYDCFIFVDDTTERKTGILQFLHNFALQLRTHHQTKSKSSDFPQKAKANKIPLIALLLQGKITQIDLILSHLKEGIPLVIFEGSGGLADLLAFAYSQIHCRPEGTNLSDYIEAVLKPVISNEIREFYPDITSINMSFLMQKIFACLRYSTHLDQEFITILNLNYIEFHPSHLPSLLLRALFKSKTSDTSKDMHQKRKDLLLAMDWNSPDVAREEVFARETTSHFQIDNEMFFRALTEPLREDFVSLFIDQGFLIHRFLDSVSLTYLFQNSLKKEFFRSVVWENILGFGSNVEISRGFLDSRLIMLIEEFTGIPSLINSYVLDWNHRAIYDDRTPEEAERKAITVLSFWAILSYRIQLAKTLWKHSEQPVKLALACSILLRKLGAFVTDMSLKNELEKQSKEFSEMAVDVMTVCYENVPCRALDLLNEKNRVWSFKTVLELAAFTKNKMFLSHPSCQKNLDNMFLGHIKIRDLPYGDITIPLFMKIILSAFLIFPMCMWVRFDLPGKSKLSKNGLSVENSSSEDISSSQSSEDMTIPLSSTRRKKTSINFFLKLYYLWSAPITKFWVWQVFYVLFLVLFSLAVIWPACGNVFLDFFTCIWIAIFILDSIYHAYTLNIKYTSMPLVYKCLEISLMILFLFGYAMGRIIWKHKFMTPYQAKVMLCVALLYFYYRVIFIALPISAELGPMLYRVRRMVAVDFTNFMRITILVMISNGIVIHSTIYPDYPLNWELFRRVVYDSLISLFLTPANHFGVPDPKCIRLKRGINKKTFVGYPQDECKVGRYLKYDCPNPGAWPYIFGLQYFIILRLILGVMLFALFSNTTRKLQEEGKYIWKYQRYELVINFSNRLTLPPPLSILTLIYIFLRYMWKLLLKCCAKTCFKEKTRVKSYESPSGEFQDKLENIDFRYWKSLAMKHCIQKQQNIASEMTTKKRMEQTNSLVDALNKQSKLLRDLAGHLNELQIQITNAHQAIGESGFQISKKEKLAAKNAPQIISRISPYPDTMISRFPVSDIHVPWKNSWTMYDPISFTLPKDKYPASLKPYVDVDIQKHREIEGEEFKMPHFCWNQISLSPGGVCVDRQSWITDKSNNVYEYELDSEDLPQNPIGRTGLKGRGSLLRWGPNHYIYVLITRWHEEDKTYDKYLDIILVGTDGHFSLPGGYVYTENRYEIIRSLFQCETIWHDSVDMISFFDSLKGEPEKGVWETIIETKSPEHMAQQYFKSERVKLGYMDEETNTDQAWCEAEIWHFHYDAPTAIEEKFKANMNWYLLVENTLMEVSTGQAAIIHTTAKKMKAYLEAKASPDQVLFSEGDD